MIAVMRMPWSTRRSLRHIAWMCACFALIGAIAPAISKMVLAAQGVRWVEICSTEGRKLLAINDDGKELPRLPGLAEHACGYCLLQQQSPFVPSASMPAVAPHPLACPLALETRSIACGIPADWPAHRPRGPPPNIS